MEEGRTLTICNSSDAIVARAKVRELARARGLDLAGQARISLAMYSLANALKIGYEFPGQVVVDRLVEGKRIGMTVACITAGATKVDPASEVLESVRWMVDDLIVETLPSGAVKVTLVQWTTPKRHRVSSGQERSYKII
jgi:urease gamma subunit